MIRRWPPDARRLAGSRYGGYLGKYRRSNGRDGLYSYQDRPGGGEYAGGSGRVTFTISSVLDAPGIPGMHLGCTETGSALDTEPASQALNASSREDLSKPGPGIRPYIEGRARGIHATLHPERSHDPHH